MLSERLRWWADRYIWWKSPDEVLAYPERILAQVMNMGTHEDVMELVDLLGSPALRQVLQHAEIGWFNATITFVKVDYSPHTPPGGRFCTPEKDIHIFALFSGQEVSGCAHSDYRDTLRRGAGQ
jgi:hypothetical protein